MACQLHRIVLAFIMEDGSSYGQDCKIFSSRDGSKKCKKKNLTSHFGTTVDDFYRFNRNAIEASFASSIEKELLLEKLKQAYYPD